MTGDRRWHQEGGTTLPAPSLPVAVPFANPIGLGPPNPATAVDRPSSTLPHCSHSFSGAEMAAGLRLGEGQVAALRQEGLLQAAPGTSLLSLNVVRARAYTGCVLGMKGGEWVWLRFSKG